MTEDDGMTTGRRMSTYLQDALDNCLDRGAVIRAMQKLSEEGGAQAPLYAAIAVELLMVQLREAETLHRLEATLAETDGS